MISFLNRFQILKLPVEEGTCKSRFVRALKSYVDYIEANFDE